ncbi:DUF1788 domain-containing protein [Luteimicrobium subarcticum]|uniref:Uncharacterized protein DUF1788 n=1 Tax=Luteimicrobium subarcticum TaxID=620910 RepID=A0A2M8WRK1_9MICO|nr:DUF1788 domain-containing protein [Luteimicrobium subarcticum]PJI93570.1 uncharacterized protein DUF1788 [Luteimicrobium subarcticum]
MNAAEVVAQEQHLVEVLGSKRFLQMEGIGNEVPFFIYPYDPEDALAVADAKKRIKNKLANNGVTVVEVNLYDLALEILKDRGVWDRLTHLEVTQGKGALIKPLQNMLDPKTKLVPAIREKLEAAPYDVFLLTGIGEVFPYIRSHNILNNIQTIAGSKPMLMFFPGEYKQSSTSGSSLVLFGRLKDDNYYRAFDIRTWEV